MLEGVRVVALDFRGHGLSAHSDSYRFADYEHDLVSLLDRLRLADVTAVGHSLGGYVALLAASQTDRIGRVLAIDVKSDWTEEDAAFAERSREASQRIEPDRELLLTRLAKSLAPTALAPEELEVLAERAIEPARRRLAISLGPARSRYGAGRPVRVPGSSEVPGSRDRRICEPGDAARKRTTVCLGDPGRDRRDRRGRRAPRRARRARARRRADPRLARAHESVQLRQRVSL
jgi:pimeloyl-ACP methyl ester carboxylesterase